MAATDKMILRPQPTSARIPPLVEARAGLSARPTPSNAGERSIEGADDLKRIKGIGVRIENLLNRHGIFRYDQIAAWNEENIATIDDRDRGGPERHECVSTEATSRLSGRFC